MRVPDTLVIANLDTLLNGEQLTVRVQLSNGYSEFILMAPKDDAIWQSPELARTIGEAVLACVWRQL